MDLLAPRLSAFWLGVTCQAEGGILYVYAEGQLVSGLMVAELLGSRPDTADIENVLYQVLSTVQDDLLRDWGHWQRLELAARVDALKLAVGEAWQDGESWRWGYRLPSGAVWALEPLRL
ncbi:hypothetical protein GCM10017783_15220 [Deinococcus piscis]|uniref:Uncharacterized protein n=2 Tax=Deinococcus piscis TaxID=394230 RepID=A0ABQ3K5C5_9DEIO|nr:hypothetical protein GCM10017783_15220 [Deinococcus piscis]